VHQVDWGDVSRHATFNGSATTMTDYGSYSAAGANITFNSAKASPRLSAGSMSGGKVTAKSKFYGATFEIDLQKK
jgi:hypothetical protein